METLRRACFLSSHLRPLVSKARGPDKQRHAEEVIQSGQPRVKQAGGRAVPAGAKIAPSPAENMRAACAASCLGAPIQIQSAVLPVGIWKKAGGGRRFDRSNATISLPIVNLVHPRCTESDWHSQDFEIWGGAPQPSLPSRNPACAAVQAAKDTPFASAGTGSTASTRRCSHCNPDAQYHACLRP